MLLGLLSHKEIRGLTLNKGGFSQVVLEFLNFRYDFWGLGGDVEKFADACAISLFSF